MARLAQVLLAVTLLTALPAGAYLTGALVGPPPRAENPPPGKATPTTSSEAREAVPAETPEPASSADTGAGDPASVQQSWQPRQPAQARPRPATKAGDRAATETTDRADLDSDDRGAAERGRENRGRPDPAPSGSRGRAAPNGTPDPHASGPPAAATVTAKPGKPAKPAKPTKPTKPAKPAKPATPDPDESDDAGK